MDATPIVRQISASWQELAQALAGPDFYIELICIGAALAMAWLTAALARNRFNARMRTQPPRHLDPDFLTRSLTLLAPILALLYLSIARSLVAPYGGGAWVLAIARLTGAWLIARIALLLVRSKPMAWFLAVVIMAGAVLSVSGFME